MDSAVIQQMIRERRNNPVVIPSLNPRTGTNVWTIDKAIALPGNCHVVLDGCVLRLADGVYENIFISEGAWSEKLQLKFLPNIVIEGKNGAMLDGGVWNGLCERNEKTIGVPVLRNTFILLRGAKGFRISGLRLVRGRYWGITLHDCFDGVVENLDFDFANDAPNQDGIDLRRGCHDIFIRDISGRTGDDVVALTALGGNGKAVISEEEPFPPFSVAGAAPHIERVRIERVHAACSGGHGLIRLLCHDGNCIRHVQIKDVEDCRPVWNAPPAYACIRIGDRNYASSRRALPGELSDVTIQNVVSRSCAAIKLAPGTDRPLYSNVQALEGELLIEA